MAKVDVVIPCYRYAAFLPSCVESVLSQSMADVRILIIDDASPDESTAVARRLADADQRVEVVSHTSNLGHIRTYNEGIDWASAPFFLLLSADDLLAPGALERAVAVLERHPEVVLTHGACIQLFADRPAVGMAPTMSGPTWRIRPGIEYISDVCSTTRNAVATPTAIVRTTVQKQIGGYRAELWHSGDMEMWLRFAAYGAVADTNATQAYYRVHGQNMSIGIYKNASGDYLQVEAAFDFFFGKEGSRLTQASRLHRLARRRLARRAFWTAVSQCCRGNSAESLRLIRFVWRLDAASILLPPTTEQLRRLDLKLRSILAERHGRAGIPVRRP